MLGVNFGFSLGPFRYIWVFGIAFAGDAMILDAGVNADAARENIWLDIVVIQIVANVAIELAVIVVSRIAVPGTPYLPGRIRITPERGDPGWAMHRRMNAVAGPFVRTNGPATAFMRRCIAHPGSPRSGVIRILPGRYGVPGTAIRETTITASSIATLATIWITTISSHIFSRAASALTPASSIIGSP